VTLVERTAFEELLSRHPVHNHEFEEELGDAAVVAVEAA
jgi:hypothetical protein